MSTNTLFSHRVFGLMGIPSNENSRAQAVAKLFEIPMLLLAGWIVIDWYVQLQVDGSLQHTISDWIIWGFFISETILISFLVNHPTQYLRNNWVNLLIIIFSFPLIWHIFPHAAGLRLLRLVVLFSLIIQASKTLQQVLGRNNLGSTLITSFFIIVVAGTLMSIIDPNVNTPIDGIWWAWVTVTTVGYGDIVPASNAGRLFGAILILMGIGLFTMLTANFAAFFMAKEEKDIIEKEALNIKHMHDIEKRLMLLESKLDTLLTDEQRRHAHEHHASQIKPTQQDT